MLGRTNDHTYDRTDRRDDKYKYTKIKHTDTSFAGEIPECSAGYPRKSIITQDVSDKRDFEASMPSLFAPKNEKVNVGF